MAATLDYPGPSAEVEREITLPYLPCRYARRWPHLWAQLMTDADRTHLSASQARGAATGMEPGREDVEHLVELYRGEVDRDELAARVIARTVGFPWSTRGL